MHKSAAKEDNKSAELYETLIRYFSWIIEEQKALKQSEKKLEIPGEFTVRSQFAFQ